MKTISAKPSFQGDLMIRKIKSLPKNVYAIEAVGGYFILAHSETGHHHVIERPRAEVFQSADDDFLVYIKTISDGVIEHQRSFDTHAPLKVEAKKIYEVRRQREYTPEGFRRAQD